MNTQSFLRRLAVFSLATLALGAASAPPAGASTGCPDYPLEQPFLRWLDVAHYTLAPNGGFESGPDAWALTAGANIVPGNESFFVRGAGDSHSLSLPPGSSATSGSTCVRLLDPTMRLFVRNSGSLLSTLKIEALYEDVLGIRRAQTIALLPGVGRWLPSLPVPLLANLQYPPLLTDGGVDVAFRFTPRGSLGAWTIDDVYVDPFKGS
jgi:hypothetical protein